MKKLFVLMAAAFAMVACQTDINEIGVVADGVATVEFEVGAPQMRAYSNGLSVDSLQYSVYQVKVVGENKTLTHLSSLDGTKPLDGLHTNVQIELANNKKYAVIFWAEDKDAPYEFNRAEMTVTVDYTDAVCNDENRDAFYAYKEFEVKGAATLGVELRRPFAQVNVGTSDLALAAKSNFVPETSALVVKNVCNVLNLVTGEASGGVNAEFGAYAVPTGEAFPVSGHDYLAMSYVLVGKDKGSYDVTYTITAEDDTVINNTIGAVPMQANYRTNIYGNLLTSKTDINVDINPDYEGGYNENVPGVKIGETRYNTLAEAYAAAVDGDVLVLMGDQQISESFVNTKNITLNLNGAVLSQVKECTASYEMIYNKGTLTIIDESATRTASTGKISFKDTSAGDPTYGWGSYTVRNEGTLVVNGGTIEHLGQQKAHMICAIFQYSGNSTINGGVISTPNYRSARLWNGNMTINGGVFVGRLWSQGASANIVSNLTINGGQFTPKEGDATSVHLSNSLGALTLAVTGGTFNGKIGAANPEAEGVKGAIEGGVFTTEAKEGTDAALIANNYSYVENEDGTWTVESPGYYVDASGNYHITTAKGWLWMADQNDTFFGSKTVYLDNDIDFAGVAVKVTKMQTPEYKATFDGQGHNVSNVYMYIDYATPNMALFDGHMHIKNLNVDKAQIYGWSNVGIIGANIHGNIENCHVTNSRAYAYGAYVGGIVGLHSWYGIKDCSVENSSVECYYYGAVGAIAGCLNEESNGNYTGCVVKNVRLIKEGVDSQYADWDPYFGIIAGLSYVKRNYVVTCEIENTTIKGVASQQLFGEIPTGSTVTYNGVIQ